MWKSTKHSSHVSLIIYPNDLKFQLQVLQILTFSSPNSNCTCLTCSFAGSPNLIAKKVMKTHLCVTCSMSHYSPRTHSNSNQHATSISTREQSRADETELAIETTNDM